MSNAPSKPVSFSRPKVGYFSNRPRIYIYNFTKMPPVGAKIFHSDEYAYGANRTKLAIAFHDSFAKAPKSGGFINQLFTYLLTYLLTY